MIILPPSVISAIPIGKNVTSRPGARMVKVQTNPQVYVVARGGTLRAIPSEDVAFALYGPLWNKLIDDVNDAFFTDYKIGTPLQ